MRINSKNKTIYIVRSRRLFSVLPSGKCSFITELPEIKGSGRDAGYQRECLAVDDDETIALVSQGNQELYAVALRGEPRVTALGLRALEVCSAGANRFLLIGHSLGTAGPQIAHQLVEYSETQGLVLLKTLEIPFTDRAEWPHIVWGSKKPQWPRFKTPQGGRHSVSVNSFGITICDTLRGAVAVFDQQLETCRNSFLLPTSPESHLAACATPHGTLVLLCEDGGRYPALALIDENLRRAAYYEERTNASGPAFYGATEVVAVNADTCVTTAANGEGLIRFSLPALMPLERSTIVTGVEQDCLIAGGPDELIAAGGKLVHRIRSSGEMSNWKCSSVELQAPLPQSAFTGYVVDGAPLLKLAETTPSRSWQSTTGGTSEVAFELFNQGGRGKTIKIQVSGGALSKGLVDAITAEMNNCQGAFTQGTAHLDVELLAAEKVPRAKDVKDSERREVVYDLQARTSGTLIIKLNGLKSGSDVLMLRISVKGDDGMDYSAAVGKQVVVT